MKNVLGTLETGEDVYGPREDSLLLAGEAASREGRRLLDVGTGTGFVAAAASSGFQEIVAVDIDPLAVALAERNLPNATVKQSDLFESAGGTFDLVTFNPPYLPTDRATETDAALDGGPTGREVLKRFASDLPGYLEQDGSALVLVSSITGKEEVEELFEHAGFSVEEVASERRFFEELAVLELRPLPASEI
ncbi:MAG: Release factor glutamine methyltransferase [Methanonatronarchaeales archaeon]|nr:Release factor glutamine methyltransferase [Methanonatronarchaeales archaeon]